MGQAERQKRPFREARADREKSVEGANSLSELLGYGTSIIAANNIWS